MPCGRRSASQARPATSCVSSATAAAASSPEAEILNSDPPSAPRPRISRMLFAFACLPFARTSIVAAKAAAARTNAPAGRACSATEDGSRTSSELSDTARLLRGLRDLRERRPGRGGDTRGDRTFDQTPVGEDDPRSLFARQLAERGADREERAAEVGQHDRPGARVGLAQRLEDA